MSGRDVEFPWHLGVFDAHCHPTDTMSSVSSIRDMKAKALTIMATRAQDQELVSSVAESMNSKQPAIVVTDDMENWRTKVIPAFGWHPWFSYQIFDDFESGNVSILSEDQILKHYQDVLVPEIKDKAFLLSLPELRPFSHFLKQTEDYLDKYPLALIGEVGLDKAFRIPEAWLPEHRDNRDDSLTPGGREGRRLSPYRVSMEHQRKVLKAQLQLAAKKKRAVSVHGVQVHGILFQTLSETWKGHERKVPSRRERKRLEQARYRNAEDGVHENNKGDGREEPLYPPRICLHSYSGPPDQAKQYLDPAIPVDIFFSFSEAINFDKPSSKAADVIKILPDETILIESDLHIAGPEMDERLAAIVRRVCAIKEWPLEAGIIQLRRNWAKFVLGKDMIDVNAI